jgi:hypothetical protein
MSAEFGLKVTVGAWLDKNGERNEREIDVSITLVNQTKPADADAQKARRISSRAVGSKINVASTAATKR